MHFLQQLIFIALATAAITIFSRKVYRIRRNILLGKEENITDHKGRRWQNMLLLAFGQKKMFRNPMVAFFHFIIYAGFIIINIEVLEIVLDGALGTHRLFFKPLGGFYFFVIDVFEILALGVLMSCIVFLLIRNIAHIKRFLSHDLD